ncbi:hypothetical protein TruAng_001385 [Truncatella angustata]|nr:hypothetical protein TruAng_001385 [Truncatella angustata]
MNSNSALPFLRLLRNWNELNTDKNDIVEIEMPPNQAAMVQNGCIVVNNDTGRRMGGDGYEAHHCDILIYNTLVAAGIDVSDPRAQFAAEDEPFAYVDDPGHPRAALT